MTYYHNLKPKAEDFLSDYSELTVYDNNQKCPLLEYQNPNNGHILKQFIQAIIPDEQRNQHIFLALKNAEGVVEIDTLWTIEEMEHGVNRIG